MPIRAQEIDWGEDELAKKVDLGKIPNFLVREYERALFIRDGKIFQEFGPGTHTASKLSSMTKAYLIYVSLMPFQLKWGLPETMSKDNVRVGAFGTIELQVEDSKLFFAHVLGPKLRYVKHDLREDLLDNIQGVIRSELASLGIKEIYLERDVLLSVVRGKLEELFKSRGFDYKRLEIQGINIPEDIKKALESSKLHEIELGKKKGDFALEKERMAEMARLGIDAARMRELEIAGGSPDILAKKYETQAYKDALKTSRSQDVKVVTGVEQAPKEPPVSTQLPDGQPLNCPSCGKTISPNFSLCPYCGDKFEPNLCPKCGKEVEKDFALCPYCGTKF
ncbi:MAG: SPFH domain-containing protein [Candidatus Hydrothermarchaeales archaeon]